MTTMEIIAYTGIISSIGLLLYVVAPSRMLRVSRLWRIFFISESVAVIAICFGILWSEHDLRELLLLEYMVLRMLLIPWHAYMVFNQVKKMAKHEIL